jgi:hypothetical protein
MSNYAKLTNFASKDSLASGNPLKVIKGTEIDDEFEAIETAVGTKADSASPTFTGTPTAPTAATVTDSTQIATTAFVQAAAAAAVSSGINNPAADIVINSVAMGDWTIEDNGSTILNIAYNGTNIFKLDSSGNLTVVGNVTAYGTI